jgi:hypothetical protein
MRIASLAALAAGALAACGESRTPTVGGPCLAGACPSGSVCIRELTACPTSTLDAVVGVATAGTCQLVNPPCLDQPEPCGAIGVCVNGVCVRQVEPCTNRPPKCPAGCDFDAVELCACVCATCPATAAAPPASQ